MTAAKILIIGDSKPFHVGAHLRNAALALGHSVSLLDSGDSYKGSLLLRKFNWWMLGHRPARLNQFSRKLVSRCIQSNPDVLLTTGIAPVSAVALRQIGNLGVVRVNFLTDDPFNPAHDAPWFLRSLRGLDHVFSPRRGNLSDLRKHGCRQVRYLPFGYAPEIHFPESVECSGAAEGADVLFAGGADRDRIPFILGLISAGLKVHLYGHDWNKDPRTNPFFRGHADPATLRSVVAGSKVGLCLVRRANRDGHCMRSFEVPAMGGCMLAEETEEHRQILGEDGHAVLYFRSLPEMVERTQWLLDHKEERCRLARAAHERITRGRNTYADRLREMLEVVAAAEDGGRRTKVGDEGARESRQSRPCPDPR